MEGGQWSGKEDDLDYSRVMATAFGILAHSLQLEFLTSLSLTSPDKDNNSIYLIKLL